jgi:hypothetical protein
MAVSDIGRKDIGALLTRLLAGRELGGCRSDRTHLAVAFCIGEMDVAVIRVQPVSLQPLGLGNPKTCQKHEAHGGQRDRVLTIPFADVYRLPELSDLGDAQTALLLFSSQLAYAAGRIGGDNAIIVMTASAS